MTQVETEARRNYRVFIEMLPELLEEHPGRCALLHDGALIEVFDTGQEARWAGRRRFGYGNFSIQHVTRSVVDLGWYSHVWG